MAVAVSEDLKNHVYRMICRHDVPIFWSDIYYDTDLKECGISLGCGGMRLQNILLELVRDGRLVAYHEKGGSTDDDIAFVTYTSWDRALASANWCDYYQLISSREYFR
jgi:hypothetical protein